MLILMLMLMLDMMFVRLANTNSHFPVLTVLSTTHPNMPPFPTKSKSSSRIQTTHPQPAPRRPHKQRVHCTHISLSRIHPHSYLPEIPLSLTLPKGINFPFHSLVENGLNLRIPHCSTPSHIPALVPSRLGPRRILAHRQPRRNQFEPRLDALASAANGPFTKRGCVFFGGVAVAEGR